MSYRVHIASLKSDRSTDRWSANSKHRAPHKPLMLLAIIKRIDAGEIDENLIRLSDELITVYRLLWLTVMQRQASIAQVTMPFYRLQSDEFWRLVLRENEEGMRQDIRRLDSSRPMLDALYHGARLDDALFHDLCNPAERAALQHILIETYFDESLHEKLNTLTAKGGVHG